MMNNNKILTVSYGTFSCTLEGFDDSFDTMKAIAEYFRDLAADDRYFGAEPPQPDAEQLARIAEREVSRRVEAQEHEGRILLKAHDDAVEETGVSPSAPLVKTAAPDTSETQTEETPAGQISSMRTETPVEAAAPAVTETYAEEPNTFGSDTAASDAELADLDDPAIEPSAAPEPVVAHPDVEETHVDQPDTVQSDAEQSDVAQPDALHTDAQIAAAVAASSLDHDSPAAPVLPEEHVLTGYEDETEAPMEAADVSTSAPEPSDQKDAMEEFFAQNVAAEITEYDTEESIATVDFTGSLSPADTGEAASADAGDELETFASTDATDSFAEKLERIRAVVSQQTDQSEAAPSDYEEDLEPPTSPQNFGSFEPAPDMHGAEPPDHVVAQAAQDIAEAFEQDEAAFEPSELDEPETTASEEDDLDEILKRIELDQDDDTAGGNLFEEPADTDAGDAVTGRVLKVNRTDLEAALASGDLEEIGDEDDTPQTHIAEDLSEPSEDVTTAPRQSLPEIDEEASEDLSRLMAEADNQMEEPEGKTRRSAFAHLRAAVAARFADRSMDAEDQQDEAEAEAYRNDLAEVVRPRRPTTSENRTERPTGDAAAPLKLVAEQRIDSDHNEARGPIAPRRVAASDDSTMSPPETDGDFANYAAERGAKTLPELLEAAAAYLSYVEGHEQFSRPELMSRVRQADCGEFSREDGLRSFGQLLRTGKIEKIKGGRFTASEGIGYKPGHRAVG